MTFWIYWKMERDVPPESVRHSPTQHLCWRGARCDLSKIEVSFDFLGEKLKSRAFHKISIEMKINPHIHSLFVLMFFWYRFDTFNYNVWDKGLSVLNLFLGWVGHRNRVRVTWREGSKDGRVDGWMVRWFGLAVLLTLTDFIATRALKVKN